MRESSVRWTLESTAPEGVPISTLAWIGIGVAAWLAVAVVVGVLIGRMVRGRDRQVPTDAPTSTRANPRIPEQGTAAYPTGPRSQREPGSPPR